MYQKLLFTIILYLVSFFTCAQINYAHGIKQKLGEHGQKDLIEKLFIHTDRSFYVAGEILWFKIYSVNGENNVPLDLSKVAYIELLDSKGLPAIQTKISLKDGAGHGSVYLPVSMSTGNYVLRAYTSWMKNFSAEFFYEKVISITNTLVNPDLPDVEIAENVHLALFPEGGNLVDGLTSRVAFKITNESGTGISANGYLVSNEDTISNLETHRFGIGTFSFTPDLNSSYTIVLAAADSVYSFRDLPKILPKGYVMQVKDSGDYLQIDVSTNINTTDQVLLVGHTRQKVFVAEGKRIQNGNAIFLIKKDEPGEGISHITIFDNSENPVAERLFFRFPQKVLDIQLNTDKIQYTPREEVKIEVTTDGSPDEIPNADLSLSVFLSDSLQKEQDQGGILSYLLLDSELKAIESPAYYFSEEGIKDKAAIDNLMLTHGWRRFNWINILAGVEKNYQHIPELEGHIIKLKINSEQDNTDGVKMFLSVPGKIPGLYASKSNEQGMINFVTSSFFGQKNIVFQPFDSKILYSYILQNPFIGTDKTISVPQLSLNENLREALRKRSVYMQAQNIYSNTKLNEIVRENYNDSIPFYGNQSKTYILDNYTRFPTMEEVMREYVTEVSVRKRGEQFNLKVYNAPLSIFFDQNPLVLLDGTPVNDINKIIGYDPLKIRSLDIVTGTFMIGNDIWTNGVVSYETYAGDREGITLDPSQVEMNYEGLQLMREFYSPAHQNTNEHIPDFRSLLLWQPEISMDEKGKAVLYFYTSDIKGKFLIIIQGVNKNGDLGYSIKEIYVK